MVQNKARKGDVIALYSRHTSTDIKFKVTYYDVWALATVTHANRDGVVMEALPAGLTVPVKVNGHRKVFPISGPPQAAARRLVASIEYPGREFKTGDDLKAAILAA